MSFSLDVSDSRTLHVVHHLARFSYSVSPFERARWVAVPTHLFRIQFRPFYCQMSYRLRMAWIPFTLPFH